MKKIGLKIFYLVLFIYSIEALLFLFMQEKVLTMDYLKNQRITIAKQKGIEIDPRSPEKAFLDFRKIEKNLEPKFFYSPIFRFSKTFQNAKEENKLIPFRGPINSKTMSCAEEGKYNLDVSDKFGFKNSNDIYNKKINTILLGDSFAEGDCQNIENDIAGNLIKKGHNTANFGVVGTSVLVALGIIREFGQELKPNNIVYMYAEENDLNGLNWSKNDKHLISYLDKNYKVNYLNKYDEVKKFLELSSSETISFLKSGKQNKKQNIKSNIDILKDNLIDIIELKKIKNIVRYKILRKTRIDVDLDLFFSVINQMNEDSKILNSNFIFVYTPSAERYFSLPEYANLKEKEQIKLKDKILEGVKKMNITTVDLTEYFDKAENVKQYFSMDYIGHFDSDGYKKVAEIISQKLN